MRLLLGSLRLLLRLRLLLTFAGYAVPTLGLCGTVAALGAGLHLLLGEIVVAGSGTARPAPPPLAALVVPLRSLIVARVALEACRPELWQPAGAQAELPELQREVLRAPYTGEAGGHGNHALLLLLLLLLLLGPRCRPGAL